MKRIWKYPLAETDEQILLMPEGAKILHVGEQRGVICVWVEVDTDAEMEHRKFYIVGTGNKFPLYHVKYLGTVIKEMGVFVWHVYEAVKEMEHILESDVTIAPSSIKGEDYENR